MHVAPAALLGPDRARAAERAEHRRPARVPRLYSFRDLVALRVVKSLLDGGMSLQRVRRSWEFLNKKADLDQHLSEVQLVTDGQSIFKVYRRDGEVMDALKEGQMAFFVAIDDIATSVRSNVASSRRIGSGSSGRCARPPPTPRPGPEARGPSDATGTDPRSAASTAALAAARAGLVGASMPRPGVVAGRLGGP